jgi:hypothetical protein
MMTATLLSLTLAVLVGAADSKTDKDKPRGSTRGSTKPRKPHPYAPSLPELSDEEEKKLDEIIDRFMLYDIGKLRGKEGAQAYREFVKLGPEAIPALLRGINRAAAYDESCPVVVIAKKLNQLLAGSTDVKLMQFARDEIGASIGRTRHGAVLQDLRVSCMLRKNALMRAGYGTGVKAPSLMTTAELVTEAGRERGQRLKSILFELSRRPGDDAISTLGSCAASYQRDVQQYARTLLAQNLSRQRPDVVKQKLKDDKPEVRLAAIRIAATRNLPVGGTVIELLDDDDTNVRELAHQVLVKAAGTDFGPSKAADKEDRQKAMEKWRSWWSRQGGR